MKKTWMILNKSIGKKKNWPEFPEFFNIQNEFFFDKTKISEAFNDYFSKIGLLTSQNVPHTTTDYTSFMPDPIKNSMFIEPITSNSIILATSKLKTKLSSGHDDISSKLLKETIFHIVHR